MAVAKKALGSMLSSLRLIANALENHRLAHAYLITGPPGSGKQHFMERCSQLILCDDPRFGLHPEPCHICNSCVKFERRLHPDLLQLAPEGRYIKIDQIRSIQKMLSFAPLESKRRVCTITAAERLGIDAANALLKTLEEPPDNTYLLLSAISMARLLPTIVSRCQIITFRDEINSTATNREFGIEGVPEDVVPFLKYVSGKRPNLANELIESGILDLRQTLFEFLGTSRKKELFFQTSQAISNPKENIEHAIKIIYTIIRDLLLLKQPEPSLYELMVNLDKKQELTKLAQAINYDSLSEYQDRIEKASIYLDRNVNPEMIADMLLMFWLKTTKLKTG